MFPHFFKQDRFAIYLLFLAVAVGLILGISTVYATPLIVFGVLVLIPLVFLMLKKPELAILGILVLTSTLFHSRTNPGIFLGFGTIYLTDILLLTNLLLIGVRSFVEIDFKIIHTPLDKLLLLFVGMALLSTFIAITYTSLKLRESLHEMRIVANYLVFFLVTNLIRKDNQLRFLVRGMIILATLVAGATIVQYFLGTSTQIIPGRVEELYTEGVTHSSVIRIIPPGYSLMFVVFITLSVISLFDKFRTILLLPLVLTGLGVLLSFKRHLWFGVILAFLLIAYFGGKKELQKLFSVGLVGLVVIFMGLAYLNNFTGAVGPHLIESSVDRLVSFVRPSTYTDPNSSLRWRDFEYEYAIPQIVSHPLLGLGLGAEYRPHIYPKDWEEFDGRGWIHNGHVWVMVKAGLLAYTPLLILLLLFLYRGFKYWSTITESWKRGYYLGFTLAFLGMVIGAMIEPLIIAWHWTALMGVMMGVNEYILRTTNQKSLP